MSPLACPVCHAPLAEVANGYTCPAGHHFDRARQGYTNLLTRAAGQHGDNREMLLGRRAFLEGGSYAPLRDALVSEMAARLPQNALVLDAGCGEGYYGDAVLRARTDLCGYGIDISRDALKLAGSRETVRAGRFSLFVSGVYEMPFLDGGFDGVLNVFAPLAVSEYLRVLKPGGYLFLVIPGENHLYEMKEVLYDTPRKNEVSDFALPGFALLSGTPLTYSFGLEGQEGISALFSMTPYYYRTPEEGKARLAALDALALTADFHLLTYRAEENRARS